MEDSNLYQNLIFLLQKCDTNTGKNAGWATAPFFLNDENNDSITINQIRDVNFSEVFPEDESLKFHMKLYVINKNVAQNLFGLDGTKLFHAIISHIASLAYENQELEINEVPLKLLVEIKFPILSNIYKKINKGVLEMHLEKFSMPNNQIYLYNPSITLSKDYLNKKLYD
jgi:hypothetical protein